ncbi:MAG: hypothetical protein WA949_23555 [Phormidesmis sp.]
MAPPFRYGIVGIEVDKFRTYSELLEDWTVTCQTPKQQSYDLGLFVHSYGLY